jgi:hypothetical protein
MMSTLISEDDIARRRSTSRRLAWALGVIALVLYVIGFFIQR